MKIEKLPQDLPELPEGINIPIIEMIHTGGDAFIPFMRKNPDTHKMENLFSLPREGMRTYFPELLHWLMRDAYVGVNSTYRPAPWENKRTGLPDALRGEGELRYLNAVYADLDVGRPDDPVAFKRTPWAKALAVAEMMMNEGQLPQASIYARSGRGLYLLWLIRDKDDPNQPQKAWPEKIDLYKSINRALAHKLRKLAADPQAIDAARVLKVPGTIDSKTGRRVGYWFRLDDRGMPFLHTLEGLAAAALQPGQHDEQSALPGGYLAPLPAVRIVKERGKYPKRIEGLRARNFARVKDLIRIEAWKHGFPEGMRRRALTLLAECMKFSGTDEHSIRSMIEIKARNCRPPYPSPNGSDTPIEAIVRDVWQGRMRLSRAGDAALCRDFGITKDVAVQLELQSIMPKELKAEFKAEEREQLRQEKAAHWAEIQAAVKRLWHLSGKGYSYRKLAAALTHDGFPVSYEKVRLWFKAGKIDKRFKPKR
jgi:hypothetical protein